MEQPLAPLSFSGKHAQAALEIIHILHTNGYVSYLAGGSVRDLLMGAFPKDYDIVTRATPEIIEQLFPETIPVGKQFGILIVRHKNFSFEVATFRGERGYSDKRRPDVVYWSDAKHDATRRDFTVNALFYDPREHLLIDYVGGRQDLQAKIIRFVGSADKRVQEDPLRMLRAIRLKNQLGFQYEPTTYRAIKKHAKKIRSVSGERIVGELNLMFGNTSRAQSFAELDELGLLAVILPEIDILHGIPQPQEFHKEGDVFQHTYQALKSLPAKAPTFLVWAVLFHDAGKADTIHYPDGPDDRIRFEGHRTAGAKTARRVGLRLHMPRVEIDTIAWLVDHHMNLKGIDTLRESKRRAYLLDPRFPWLLELHRADALGTVPNNLTLYQEVKGFYAKYLGLWKKEQKTGPPKQLVTGTELMKKLGIEQGPLIGKILKQVAEAQLERTITTKKDALALAETLIKR